MDINSIPKDRWNVVRFRVECRQSWCASNTPFRLVCTQSLDHTRNSLRDPTFWQATCDQDRGTQIDELPCGGDGSGFAKDIGGRFGEAID